MASDAVREGVLAINKPRGPSSAQIVRDCQQAFSPSALFKPVIESELQKWMGSQGNKHNRRAAHRKANKLKIGHGGTLDPLATGIIILGIGNGTKALPQFLDCAKTYEATVLFGAATDTYDRVGRVLTRRPYDHITREKVEEALENFRGKRTQIPPLYSALKMNGKPLYEYAREGKPIPREIEGREVTAYDIEIMEWYPPKSHNFHWPTEEAEAAERNLAEQVWRVQGRQETSKKLTPEEKDADDQAIMAHETFKKKFEERQDELVRDSPAKRKHHSKKSPALMSGALGKLPKGNNSPRPHHHVPDTPDANTPPPWTDEGPPAVKVRMSVSTGYYVRSFCHDLGVRLGSAALMAELSRTRQSDFTVGGVNCLEHADLEKGEEVWGPKVATMLAMWNGEPSLPEGEYPYLPDAGKGMMERPPPSKPSVPQKRQLSPFGESSHAPARKQRKGSSPRRAEESEKSEKSWNGIEE